MKQERHGERHTKLYAVWSSMKNRCNPNNVRNKGYGDRGISVCDEWKNSYISFRNWAYENGYNPDLSGRECSLDRIDVNGDYCPQNCRWVTFKEQERNMTNTHWVEYQGRKMSLAEACEYAVATEATVRRRLDDGWSVDEALNTPPIKAIRSDLRIKAESVGLNYHTVRSRIRQLGWSEEEALSVPSAGKHELLENVERYLGERDCDICGKTYIVKASNQRYCSSKCCAKAKRIKNKERRNNRKQIL